MSERPRLRELAERAGILSCYEPAGGGPPRTTSDATREAILAALGYDASDEAAAARSLGILEGERGSRARAGGEDPAEAVSCVRPADVLETRLAFGLWTNLYTLRSRHNLGTGDLTDLRGVVELAAQHGAAFVGLNPLHASRNRGHEVSPYTPLSRLFRNPLYLDVQEIPEFAGSREARALFESESLQRELRRLRGAARIDYERVVALQDRLLRVVHRAAARSGGAREGALAKIQKRKGTLLREFATFLALEEHLVAAGHPRDWRCWPQRFRDPESTAVEAFRAERPGEVDYHVFLQCELDRQLEGVALGAREAGLAIGLYQDLALGSVASGFDAWRFPDLFVDGVSLGAPPDDYATEGQDWGLPPLHPERLAQDEFRFWRLLLRAGFEHAGALRIDHILGIFRQWWVPAGRPAGEGAYVRFPSLPLLQVLARESRAHGALVIGEDLGTVPPEVAPALARFGVLSSRVLLFERDSSASFRAARRYSDRALVTANTHDLPTLPGYWLGRDLELRRELGLFPDVSAYARAQSERALERQALLQRLRAEGCLEAAAPSVPELCSAVHDFLSMTPSPLVGISLDDLAGEAEAVNLPGIPMERHPSWTRRMALPVEALADDPGVRIALEGATRRSLAGL